MTYYKTIVTLTSGHRHLRLSISEVAHFVTEWKKFHESIFRDVVKKITLNGISLCLNECVGVKFLNEYTREELLTLS